MKFLKLTDKDGDFVSYYNFNNIVELTKYEDYDATENNFKIELKFSNGETLYASTVTTKIEIVEDISLY